jgi:hypothetical protein
MPKQTIYGRGHYFSRGAPTLNPTEASSKLLPEPSVATPRNATAGDAGAIGPPNRPRCGRTEIGEVDFQALFKLLLEPRHLLVEFGDFGFQAFQPDGDFGSGLLQFGREFGVALVQLLLRLGDGGDVAFK